VSSHRRKTSLVDRTISSSLQKIVEPVKALESAHKDLVVRHPTFRPAFQHAIDPDAFRTLELRVFEVGIMNHLGDFPDRLILDAKASDQRFECAAMIPPPCNSKFFSFTRFALVALVWGFAGAINARADNSDYELKRIALPGANGAVALDYFAYNHATAKLWVPASNTGSVDVIDEQTDAVSQINGFKTGEIERRGRRITVGPTAATIGDGVVYIGDRGDFTLCVIDEKPLSRGECVPVSTDRAVTPDGVVYVAATRELWITTRPAIGRAPDPTGSLVVFDASDPRHLKSKTKIALDALAEGYAVDNQRGLFYTNIEDMGRTVAIDVRTHKLIAKWNAGSKDLQGLALDSARGFLFVACGDHVVSLDTAHDGKVTDSIQTGAGLDNIDYSPQRRLVYAAASQAAKLTIAEVDDAGKFHLKASVPTVKGVRGVVAASNESAYMIDPAEGCILKLMHK
jgi:DNA-binding beta-propeller fold protein YncE